MFKSHLRASEKLKTENLQIRAVSQSWWRAYEQIGLWYFRLLWGGTKGTQHQYSTRLRNALGLCFSWALLVVGSRPKGRASCLSSGEVRIGCAPPIALAHAMWSRCSALIYLSVGRRGEWCDAFNYQPCDFLGECGNLWGRQKSRLKRLQQGYVAAICEEMNNFKNDRK